MQIVAKHLFVCVNIDKNPNGKRNEIEINIKVYIRMIKGDETHKYTV